MSDDNTSKDDFKVFLRSIACGNPRCKELDAKLVEAEKMLEAYSKDRIIRKEKLKVAVEALEMVEDNSKMPHQHTDLQTRLYCLAERAKEALEKIKGQG